MMQRIGALLQRHGRVWRAPRVDRNHTARGWTGSPSPSLALLQAALRTYLAALEGANTVGDGCSGSWKTGR